MVHLALEMSAVDRRRELNRLAAQKLRNRQKEKAVTVKQEYFAAQSRNTQLLYDVKQLRKQKNELSARYEAHMCRHAGTEVRRSQTVDHPASQSVCTDAVSQGYAVITSGQQQFLSPVLLLSDRSGLVPPTSVQLVSVAPLDAGFANGVDLQVINSSSVKEESDCATSETRLVNGDTAFCGETTEMLNGVCQSNSIVGNRVNEVVQTMVDARAKSHIAAVVDVEKTVGGALSVPASPVTKRAQKSRRRRSTSSLPHDSEPAVTPLKRATTRHMSSDQLLTAKAAADSDNLPSFLSSMTDDE